MYLYHMTPYGQLLRFHSVAEFSSILHLCPLTVLQCEQYKIFYTWVSSPH